MVEDWRAIASFSPEQGKVDLFRAVISELGSRGFGRWLRANQFRGTRSSFPAANHHGGDAVPDELFVIVRRIRS